MERNLRLYPLYQTFRSAFFWLPIFFLYFLSALSLAEALELEALYYLAAVLLEVPSGYFSDRVGRRATLLVAVACGAAAALVFATTASFWPFALAQVLRAASNAFNSGTDTSLLYDSLAALGREEEIAAREGRAYARGLLAASVTCLVGGLAGGLDLRIAWWLTAAANAATLAVVWRFREPPRDAGQQALPLAAMGEVASLVRQRPLGWVFVLVMGMIVLNHVPFEFFQPYLDLLFGGVGGSAYRATPAVSGALAACMWLLGAAASARAVWLRAHLGVPGALLASMALQLAIVVAMGAVLSPWVMALILCRSVPMALYTPIANAEIHPRVRTPVRATYFSVQSLAGRLAFAACLALASWALGGEATTHPAMAGVLRAFAAGGLVLLLALALRAPREFQPAASRSTPKASR